MKYYDCHLHTKHSHDGKNDVFEYMKELDIRTDIEAIGITEHVDFLPLSSGYKKYDYNRFSQDLIKAKECGYNVFKGAEIGYAECVREEIISHIQESQYDYIICSIHRDNQHSFSTNQTIDISQNPKAFQEKLDFYYDAIVKLLSEEFYNVVGHIGVYKRYLSQTYFDNVFFKDWLFEVEYELAKKCARSNKIIEINTSGYSFINNDSFPNANFLKNYYLHGGESVCLGSDAHSVMGLARGFERAINVLKEIGFKYITLPWDENIKIKIE